MALQTVFNLCQIVVNFGFLFSIWWLFYKVGK